MTLDITVSQDGAGWPDPGELRPSSPTASNRPTSGKHSVSRPRSAARSIASVGSTRSSAGKFVIVRKGFLLVDDLRVIMREKAQDRVLEMLADPLQPVKLSPKERNSLSVEALELYQKRLELAAAASGPSPESSQDKSHSAPTVIEMNQKPPIPSKGAETQKEMPKDKRKGSKTKLAPIPFAGNLKAPNEKEAAPLLSKVQDALHRYSPGDTIFSDMELTRMRCIFNRFSVSGSDVHRDALHETLLQLGYLTVSKDNAHEILKQSTSSMALDFQEYISFCDRCVLHEREEINKKIQAFLERRAADAKARAPVDDMHEFLYDLGISATKDSVAEYMQRGGLEGKQCKTVDKFLMFLAARQSLEGFKQAHLNGEIKASFDACQALEKKDLKILQDFKQIFADQIQIGLVYFADLYSSAHLRKVLDTIEHGLDRETSPPVTFYEFVTCCRRVREAMLKEVYELYLSFDKDGQGFISAAQMRQLCIPLGFTLVDEEWKELLAAKSLQENERNLDFDTVWSFIQEVRDQNGFTQSEQVELTSSFNKFCDGSGEMPNLQAMGLLQYMGFDVTLDEVRQLTKRVDFNSNGTMDAGEFLCLMRFQKEVNMRDYKSAYEQMGLERDGGASFQRILKALDASHLKTTPSLVRGVLDLCSQQFMYDKERQSLSFRGFLFIAETMLKKYPVELRKRAGFKDDEMELIQTTFDSQDSMGKGWISSSELIWLLQDSGMGVNTPDGRAAVFERMEKANQSALDAGVPAKLVGSPHSDRVYLMPLVHFIRDTIRENHDQVMKKEEAAAARVSFSEAEVIEFRQVFNALAQQAGTSTFEEILQMQTASSGLLPKKQGNGKRRSSLPSIPVGRPAKPAAPVNMPKTVGAVIKKFKYVVHVPIEDVTNRVNGMAGKVPSKLKLALGDMVMTVADPEGRGIDFPGFLLVMQWMVDSNFVANSER